MTVKQVIAFRRDLNMRKGKIAAQVAHASMKVLLDRRVQAPEGGSTLCIPVTPQMQEWIEGIFTKVVVVVDSEAELLSLRDTAAAAGLPVALVTDVGNTEFHGVPTHTAVAIGPARAEDLDPITGRLRLA